MSLEPKDPNRRFVGWRRSPIPFDAPPGYYGDIIRVYEGDPGWEEVERLTKEAAVENDAAMARALA
jgi:hypothetical protein